MGIAAFFGFYFYNICMARAIRGTWGTYKKADPRLSLELHMGHYKYFDVWRYILRILYWVASVCVSEETWLMGLRYS